MDRTALFKLWLERLTPEKMELLIRLEKLGRMLTHVYELNGTIDEKLFEGLRITSHQIREEYQPISTKKAPNAETTNQTK